MPHLVEAQVPLVQEFDARAHELVATHATEGLFYWGYNGTTPTLREATQEPRLLIATALEEKLIPQPVVENLATQYRFADQLQVDLYGSGYRAPERPALEKRVALRLGRYSVRKGLALYYTRHNLLTHGQSVWV